MNKLVYHLLSFLLTVHSWSAFSQAGRLVVNDNAVLTHNYIGNGVQWSAYSTLNISDADWQKTFDRLDFMKVNFVRLMVPTDDYCTTYPKGGQPEYVFDSERMERTYKILDYCQSRNVQVILGDWSDPVRNNKVIDPTKKRLYFDGIQEYDPRWTEIIGELLNKLLVDKKYSCIKYYNLGNEPNGFWMSCESFDTWKQSIINLDAELRKRRLRDKIKIVGPDAAWGNDWIKKIIDDKDLVKNIDTYEVHWYASKPEIEEAKFQKDIAYWREYISQHDADGTRKQFFMGEAGMVHGKNDKDQQTLIGTFKYGVWMADFIIQSMNSGQAGLIAWDLDDAMHSSGQPGKGNAVTDYDWKVWGFWDSFGTEKGHPEWEDLRPWYYTWSLLSRYVPKGSDVLKTSPLTIDGIRYAVSRITGPHGKDYTIAAVNETAKDEFINLSLPLSKNRHVFTQYSYTDTRRPTDKNGYPVADRKVDYLKSKGGLKLVVPANSVIVLTSITD
jgi:hypothetical protein